MKERAYPKQVNQEGDVQRYGELKAIKKDETIFAAYDKAEMRKAKIMIVASSDFVYTSTSLFWPDAIMLAALDLDLMQSVSMVIGVQRQPRLQFPQCFESGADALEATTEPADEGTSTLKPPSPFMETSRNLPESGSPSNSKDNEQRLLTESPKKRRTEGAARVPFLGTLPKEEWEVHHRDHENKTGSRMDRVAFMEEVCTVVQSYGTQSILKLGLNRPLMREFLDKLDKCEGRLSELLIDSATDESEANSPIKMTPQKDKGEVVYLSRTQKGTMRSKLVIDKVNEMKMKLGTKVILRKAGKTKLDSEILSKAVNSAKRKRVKEAMDLGQGDDRLPGTDRMLTDVAMVPPILMVGKNQPVTKPRGKTAL